MCEIKFGVSSAYSAPASAPILLHGSIENNLRQAAALGYQGLEVHMRENDPCDVARVRGEIAQSGVEISAIATGRLYTQGKVNLVDSRPYVASAAMEGMRRYIALAAGLRTNLVLGWAIGNAPEGEDTGVYRNRLAAALRPLCMEAAEAGVRIFVEVINRYEVNLITTAQTALDWIGEHDLLNCYVHLDAFHMGIDETDPYAAIRACGSKLGYFHAADNTRKYPGSGQFDFAAYFQALRETGYSGYVTVECLPWPDGITAAQRALQHLKQFA